MSAETLSHAYFGEVVLHKASDGFSNSPITRVEVGEGMLRVSPYPLSTTESNVLVMSALGMSKAATAELFERQDATISHHRKNVLRKLSARCIEHAVARGFDPAISIFEVERPLEPLRLPSRTLQIIDCLGRGLGYSGAAKEMFLSVGAMKYYLTRAYGGSDDCKPLNAPSIVFAGYMSRQLPLALGQAT